MLYSKKLREQRNHLCPPDCRRPNPCAYVVINGRQCLTLHTPPSESAVEEPARAKREANKKASSNALQGLDQAPAKAVAGSLQKQF